MAGLTACVAAIVLTTAAAPAAGADPSDRFVAWLSSHPEVELVTVASASGALEPFASRFPARKREPLPASARVRVVDGRGSLVCAVRAPAANVCVRGPAAAHLWTDRTREGKGSLVEVLLLGPLSDRRVALYELRLPEATVRVGKLLPLNPLWVDPVPGPWWAFKQQGPVAGGTRAALKTASIAPAAETGPDWLADAVGFSVLTTGNPNVLRLETDTEVAACVRGPKGWRCGVLPAISVDDVHPGLPPTDRRLPRQAPVIYRAHATQGDDRITLALERHWIRSKVARTPNLENTGTFVEVVELGPGASTFSRRAVLEMTSGDLMDVQGPAGFPTVGAFSVGPSGACLDLVAAGAVPPKMRTAPPGRYCLTAGGRLARQTDPR